MYWLQLGDFHAESIRLNISRLNISKELIKLSSYMDAIITAVRQVLPQQQLHLHELSLGLVLLVPQIKCSLL